MATKTKKATTQEPEPVAAPVKITAFKGFNHLLQCMPNGTPFQFEVGKTYTIDGKVSVCNRGFHAVDAGNPLHVWDYYPPVTAEGKFARYAEVELSGATARAEGEKGVKIAAAEITIKAELTLPDFIKRAVSALIDAAKGSATLAASGYYATMAASGDSATLAASGDYAKLAASGYYAKLAASGYSAKLAASGDSATLAASGKNSVIAASSPGCTASGADGTWISLAEFVDGKCVGFATGCIGADGLKPDTLYRARGGKLVEA